MLRVIMQSALLCGALLSSHTVMAKTILVLGDSISAGYGIRLEQGWVNKLQQRLNTAPYATSQHHVINASVSGETTSGGLTRLPLLLTKHKPDVVVIELGGNDGLRGQPPALMANNLTRLIQMTQAKKAEVIVLGMKIPPNYGSAYTQAFEQVFLTISKKTNVPLMPFFLDGVAGHTTLMQADRIHPRAEAQTILLENAWPFIKAKL
jgi:acyl-CoA thioesterase-1